MRLCNGLKRNMQEKSACSLKWEGKGREGKGREGREGKEGYGMERKGREWNVL